MSDNFCAKTYQTDGRAQVMQVNELLLDYEAGM